MRIFWTSDELNLLAPEMVKLCLKGHSIIQSGIQAQRILPENRRRDIKGAHNIPTRLQKMLQRMMSTELKAQAQPAAPAQEAPAEEFTELEKVFLGLARTIQDLSTISPMLTSINNRLTEIEDLLLSSDSFVIPPIVKTDIAKKAAKPKVLVFGLNADQQNAVQHACGESFSFTFHHEFVPSLKASLPYNDKVIGVTKFMSHGSEAILKKHNNYVRLNGSASSVIAHLQAN